MTTVRRGLALALAVGLLTGCGSPGDARAQDTDPDAAGPGASVERAPADPGLASAPDSALAGALSRAFRAAAERTLPAVVFVSVEREVAARRMPIPEPFQRFFQMPEGQEPHFRQEGTGSGFIYGADGHVMTNHHVVANASRVSVRLRDGREFSAEVLGSDPGTDVAILKMDPGGEDLPVAELGDSDRLAVGDWVLALGNPLGLDFTVTAGIVSAKGRQLTAREAALEAFIQTDAAINMGNSGGPLIDLMGRVVGINTAISGGQRWVGYGFAVPVNLARRVAGDLIEYGRVRRPRLGVRVSDVTAVDAERRRIDAELGEFDAEGEEARTGSPLDEDTPEARLGFGVQSLTPEIAGELGFQETEGVVVSRVTPNSNAQEAGVRRGQLLLRINDTPVRSVDDVREAVSEIEPGQVASLRVRDPELGRTIVNFRARTG